MPLDPDELKELEEIKRLLDGDPADASYASEQPEPHIPVSGVPVVRQQSGIPQRKPAPGLPAASQKSGADKPGLPAVRPKPAVPQQRQSPGAPAVQKPPSPPRLRQEPGVPSTSHRRSAPMGQSIAPPRQGKALPPSTSGDRSKIRSYDISSDGKISEHKGEEPDLDTGSEDFDVKFDFESAYRDVPENRPLRLRREKRTGCVGGILYAAFVISISIVLASVMWMAAVDVLGFNTASEQVNVTVPQGFAMEDITDMLYDAGLIKYKFLFNIYAGFSNAEDKITAGYYVLNMNHDYRALVQGMTARAGVRVETTVTIPEGYTLTQIFNLLVDYRVCSTTAELWDTATYYNFNYRFLDKKTRGDRQRLEGFLFPDTYNFYIDSSPVQAIDKLLNEFDKRFTETYTERAEKMGYTIKEIINIASLIEREAGSDEERSRIAAVIYNRLDSKDFPNLQIDATYYYAAALTGATPAPDLDHPYNTYLYEGLPPGPIANPGITSIRAALYPDSTNEYYYALNKDGTHNFFRTRAQHEAFIQSDDYGGG